MIVPAVVHEAASDSHLVLFEQLANHFQQALAAFWWFSFLWECVQSGLAIDFPDAHDLRAVEVGVDGPLGNLDFEQGRSGFLLQESQFRQRSDDLVDLASGIGSEE